MVSAKKTLDGNPRLSIEGLIFVQEKVMITNENGQDAKVDHLLTFKGIFLLRSP